MARSSGMGRFYYARHFGALAAATVILFLLGQWSLLKDSLIVTFAASGALHASALVFTLRAPESLRRKTNIHGIKRWRPFWRRRFNALRPPGVLMRIRNPCVLARRRRFG